MLRIIVKEVDCGAAANVGGPVYESYKTFDVEIPELEQFLSSQITYNTRAVVGVELLKEEP